MRWITVRKLTNMNRPALKAVEATREVELGPSAYRRANRFDPQQIYDSVTGLRRREVLPPTSRPKRQRPRAAFMVRP